MPERRWQERRQQRRARQFVFVQVETDEGVTGWGEVTTYPGRMANRAVCAVLPGHRVIFDLPQTCASVRVLNRSLTEPSETDLAHPNTPHPTGLCPPATGG